MLDADKINALLPQTQCTRCGYQGCRPYAEAIAQDLAPINQCPPGGGLAFDIGHIRVVALDCALGGLNTAPSVERIGCGVAG